MNFNKWLKIGMKKGYCTGQFCQTHDGGPMTPKEEQAWDNGDDPCCHLVRLGTPVDWDRNI